MIMTVAELRQFVTTDGIDPALLEARLQALELLIRGYTNNNFQKRPFRAVAVAVADEGDAGLPYYYPLQRGRHTANQRFRIEFRPCNGQSG